MNTCRVKVFIQNQAGSFVKHYHDEKNLVLHGSAGVSRPYPFPYGFILGTTGSDGLNVDCFVLTERPFSTGQIVECEPIGLLEQIEDGKEDHNVVAVVRGEKGELNARTQRRLVEFVTHVFDHIPGKAIRVGAFRDKQAAVQYVSKHLDAAPNGSE